MVVYETERLILKVLESKDTSLILDYFIRNKDFLNKWESMKPDTFYTIEYQRQLEENDFIKIKKGKLLKLWIFKKSNVNKIIGCIAFNNVIRGPFLSCFLGYRLDKEGVNRGYMTEAI